MGQITVPPFQVVSPKGKEPLQGGLGRRLLQFLPRLVRYWLELDLLPSLPFLQVWLETCLLSQLL